MVSDDAREIADKLYEEKMIDSDAGQGIKTDENAWVRNGAATVAQHFLDVLTEKETASHVMKAFYRRAHGCEVPESEEHALTVYMMTALYAYV